MSSTGSNKDNRSKSRIGILSADTVLSNFVSAYTKSEENSSNVLINALLQSFAAKMSGHMNAPYSSSLIDLCQVIRHKSKSAYSFLCENLLLPSLRHLVRLENTHMNISDAILSITDESISNRLDAWAKMNSSYFEKEKIVVSLSYDATKLVKLISVCPTTKIIVGKKAPHHIM